MGYNLGAKAVSRSVRNYKLLDPYEDMHRMFDLFVLYRKTCSSPSVLVIDICVESRIWPRIESGPLQCLWLNDPPPIWKFPVSVLRQGINNLIKSCPAWKEGRDLRRRKSVGMFFNRVAANPPLSFPESLHHEPIRAWSGQKADKAECGGRHGYWLLLWAILCYNWKEVFSVLFQMSLLIEKNAWPIN